jgi:predicted NAD/FAD-binding protein
MALIKLNNRGVRNVSTFGSVGGGSMTFIKKLTASSSATLSFVDGSASVVLDDTYKEYLFTFNNMHPATDSVDFQFNMSVDGGSNYNVTKTSTSFRALHRENDTVASLAYYDTTDLAQSTAFKSFGVDTDSDNDSGLCGYLHLFSPSSTTFVKHFVATATLMHVDPRSDVYHFAGYGNTTSAVDAIQFKFESGNIDAGDICLYGIK